MFHIRRRAGHVGNAPNAAAQRDLAPRIIDHELRRRRSQDDSICKNDALAMGAEAAFCRGVERSPAPSAPTARSATLAHCQYGACAASPSERHAISP